ncbi:substrate-binding periplasmic protein [Janthinobacterium fluminis]|uniref:Transporter substrate-binding domain-containing protein n=1 Tax=Janthinobacterium fluminis TaxID=2987524 RepID=A0ABT5K470_9BURK|nr:transporter substrate-binding domain-containing protein [Janthinobacterium fluminis]MDC8759796.1 transporter substrate-binding domain-containing protein [Janthinobacterium fluminis]
MLTRLILCCLLLGAGAEAAARQPGPAGCAAISVAFYDHGALYYRSGGAWSGIDKDLVTELGRRSGCRFRYLTDSRVRIWAMIQTGTLDMSVSAIPTTERKKFARFVPYMATRNYVLLPKSLAVKVRSLDEFLAEPSYKIAVVKSFKHGPTYDAWLDKLRAQGRVYDTADYTALVHLLKIGRVQAVLSLPTSWMPLFKNGELNDDFRPMDWAPRDVVVGALVLSRQTVPAATVQLFERTMREMRADGTLKAIFERHVSADIAAGMLAYPGEPEGEQRN